MKKLEKTNGEPAKYTSTAKGNDRLILTAAISFFAVGIIYMVSTFVGGTFYEFCANAIRWVLLWLGVAFAIAYMSQKNNDDFSSRIC